MIKQFYTSVRAAFKGVPLPLIHIYHPASPPIRRHHTAPHYFMGDICHPVHSASPAAFNMSAATPDGRADLPFFAFAISCLTSYIDCKLATIDATSRLSTS